MARNLRWFAVLAVLAVLAAACGDSAVDVGDDTTTTTPTTVDGAGDGDASDATLVTLIEGLPGIDDDCLAIGNLFITLSQAATAAAGQGAFDLDDAIAQFEQATDALPGELEGAAGVLQEGFTAYYQALASIDLQPGETPSAEQLAEFDAAADVINTPEFEAATDALSEYAEEQCA